MASEFTIPNIIQIYKISSYLSGNENAFNLGLKSGTLQQGLQKKILMEGQIMEYAYNLNPSGSANRSVAEYVLSLCGKYIPIAQTILANLSGALPVITGPSNQSVNVGQTAIFSVTVVSSTPVTYQWYDQNGNPIIGATNSSLSIPNSQLSQSGSFYYVKVANSAGTVTSNTATLTVTAAVVGYYYYGTTDYTSDLQSGNDNVPYLGTFPITHAQPLSVSLPSGASNNQWEIFKYPVGEGIKTTWFNTNLNQGNIPDSVFQSIITIGSFYYIYSRVQMSIDTTMPMVLS